MNFWKILLFGLLLWVFLLLEKYLFFEVWQFSAGWQAWVYYILLIVACRVLSRRFGVINFVEAVFIAIIWMLEVLLLDSMFAKGLLSDPVFRSANYWWSFFVIPVAVFFLHKKRHIYVRKLLHEKHHGHGYH